MKVYLVAGEPSGDLLASGLIDALRRADPSVEFRGVGGESMAERGLQSLFDIEEISVMGVFEVLPNLRRILRRIRQTADDIAAWQPDVLVTVDSWGFVSQLVAKLRKRDIKFPVVHYVAPQVWAWKKGRAKNVAHLVDRLMTLLPDESRFFEKYGLRCDFVGHPVVERMAAVEYNAASVRSELGLAPGETVICVLPGSRRSEVSRLMPIFKKSLEAIRARYGGFSVIIPTVPGVEGRVKRFFADSDIPVRVVTGRAMRYKSFTISEIALAKSGTVSLELAALGVPHLIAYRFNALTDFMVRTAIRIRFANLLNLQADREIIPEYVLYNCRPGPIAECALRLLFAPEAARAQVAEAREMLGRLRLPGILPSDRAARIVIEAVAAHGKK
ncbi:MAG: lipid-A-disaccharide synthase [Rikenellaceae bacterium]|jgi:lipid-A-disaccharide synthase|nr:lipid-A-disaccharide synthase [Rikenellaceae bacterium]